VVDAGIWGDEVVVDRDFEEAPVELKTVICSANQFRQEWMVEGIEG
jgi:hypothetical protein